jgi:DNA polymerase-1
MIRLAHRKVGGVVFCAWEDPKRRTRSERTRLFSDYKGQKVKKDGTKVPEAEIDFSIIDLRRFVEEQRIIIQDVMSAIGCPQAYAPSWEADDVIATVCEQMTDNEIVIFTGDKDMYALLRPGVTIMRPRHGAEGYDIITHETWKEHRAVPPHKWSEVLALWGDSSDNIPGVRGIGEVWAERLIAEFGSLDMVIEAAKQGLIKRFSESIVAAEPQLRLNKLLTELRRDAQLEFIPPARDERKVAAKLREWRFHSMTSHADFAGIMEMGCAWDGTPEEAEARTMSARK